MNSTIVIASAKRIECDDGKGRFEAQLGKIAWAKMKPANSK